MRHTKTALHGAVFLGGCGCAVAHDRSQRDAAWYVIGGGDAITVAGAMNRSTSPPCRRQTGSGSGERSGASLFSPTPPTIRSCRNRRFPRPCRFGHGATVGFCARGVSVGAIRRGLIYQAQNGYGHAVAHDRSQRDAAWYVIGGGDAITVVGAMNRSTSPPCRRQTGSGSGERSGASLFSPPPPTWSCRNRMFLCAQCGRGGRGK